MIVLLSVQRCQMKFSSVTDGAVSCIISQVDPKRHAGWILRELLIQTLVGGCSLSKGNNCRLEIACTAITFCAGSLERRLFQTARCRFENWAWYQPLLRRSHSNWRTQMLAAKGEMISLKCKWGKQKSTLKTSPMNFSGKLLLSQRSLGKTGFKSHLYPSLRTTAENTDFCAVWFERVVKLSL